MARHNFGIQIIFRIHRISIALMKSAGGKNCIDVLEEELKLIFLE